MFDSNNALIAFRATDTAVAREHGRVDATKKKKRGER